MYHGQWLQDKVLNEEIFFNKKNGSFIEIGCASPVDCSNSYFFETILGWQGICIDARQSACVEFAKSRKANVINAVLGKERGRSIFFDYGLLAGLAKFMSQREHEQIEQYYGSNVNVNANWVDVIPFADVLQRYSGTFDLLMIDTEGAELAILQSIDNQIERFNVALIESNTDLARKAVVEHMHNFNFRYYKTVGADDIFIKNDRAD